MQDVDECLFILLLLWQITKTTFEETTGIVATAFLHDALSHN